MITPIPIISFFENSVDPDQLALKKPAYLGPTVFFSPCKVCLVDKENDEECCILNYYTSHEFPIQNYHRRTTDIYTIIRCNSDGKYYHSFAITAGDSKKYQSFN